MVGNYIQVLAGASETHKAGIVTKAKWILHVSKEMMEPFCWKIYSFRGKIFFGYQTPE